MPSNCWKTHFRTCQFTISWGDMGGHVPGPPSTSCLRRSVAGSQVFESKAGSGSERWQSTKNRARTKFFRSFSLGPNIWRYGTRGRLNESIRCKPKYKKTEVWLPVKRNVFPPYVSYVYRISYSRCTKNKLRQSSWDPLEKWPHKIKALFYMQR